METSGRAFGNVVVGSLFLMVLVAMVGITHGLVILETWRVDQASRPLVAQPTPALAAIDVDDGAAAAPAQGLPPASRIPGRAVVQTGACVVGGLAGTGAAMVVGPAEVAGLVAGAVLAPVSVPLTAAVLGGSFVTGCAASVVMAPMFR